jgi:hypothetical protein
MEKNPIVGRNFELFPSVEIGIDPAEPSDPGSGLYYDPKRRTLREYISMRSERK